MRASIKLATILGIILVNMAFASETSRPGQIDFARVNSALANQHILPRYAQLSQKTGSFAQAVQAYCTDQDDAGRVRLRAQYREVLRAWMSIQHVRFGPVELFMRGYRFYFWPQARGKVHDAVDSIILAGNETALLPSRISQSNVAVQGLLAAEILLHDARYLVPGSQAGAMGCRLLEAVALNLSQMSADILSEWQEGATPFVRVLAEPGPENAYFREHRDGTLVFFQSLHDSLQYIAEVKLGPVIGDSFQTARPHLAETRLSRSSLDNVIGNLEAVQALYNGEGDVGLSHLTQAVDIKLDQLLRKAFRMTLVTARSLDRPLEEVATDPAQRATLEKLLLQVRALRQITRDRLAPALALPVGFNAFDGD